MIEKERIESGFRLRSLAHRIIVLEAIGSTNTYAKLLIDSPDSEGTIVVADEQTSGKGRMTRTWHSPKGGLYFSIVLKANKDVSSYALYALMAACCVHEAVKTESGLTPHLKWPNDILVNERKLCGILSELIIKQEEWDEEVYVVLGIGINVNNMTEGFPLDLQDVATSIKMECGCDTSLEDLLVEIVSRIDWWLEGDPILSKVSQVYNN
ncbi:MAG: biotin--[acetyl-CoA-carboxylase] ligase, partial [Candidatus Thorarchaeota archaeon]